MPYVVILLAALAAATDARTGRIPNWLTLPGILCALVWHATASGMFGVSLSLIGALACGLVPWVMFRATQGKAIGGGDIKLFAALGSWLGPLHGLETELSSFLLVGLLALVQLTYRGQLIQVLGNSLNVVFNPFLPQKWKRRVAPEALTEMRMGPAICLATILIVVKTTWLPQIPWLV